MQYQNNFIKILYFVYRKFGVVKQMFQLSNKFTIKQKFQVRSQGLEPLEACRRIISIKMGSTNLLITAGQSMKKGKMKKTAEFSEDASLLGSLPEIPDLKDVPFITFSYEPLVETEAKDLLKDFGYVFYIAPVQVTLIFYQTNTNKKSLFNNEMDLVLKHKIFLCNLTIVITFKRSTNF